MANNTLYFGEKDNAHRYHEAVQVPVEMVLGLPCYWCDELIDTDASGFLQPVMKGTFEDPQWEFQPVHRWCDLRQIIGSLAHQRGECFCITGNHDQERKYEDELGKRMEAEMACKEFFDNTRRLHGHTDQTEVDHVTQPN